MRTSDTKLDLSARPAERVTPLAFSGAPRAAAASRIAVIEHFRVAPRWLFVKITTDDGLTGWGEASLEGHAEAVEGALASLRDRLLGTDPDRIEDAWQVAYRGGFYRGGPVLSSAASGIDQALWDLKGKRLGVPVWQLLGGRVRDKIEVYSWIGGDGLDPLVDAAKLRLSQGFRAIKMNGTPEIKWLDSSRALDSVLERVATVKALGLEVAIDFHGRLHKAMAKQLACALEPLKPLFIEEPLLSENLEGLRQLAQLTSIPIALGERLYSRWDFKEFLSQGIVDIVQPDPSHAGGISESRRIAAAAEAHDVGFAPHCPLGPLAFASCLQLAAATPNFMIEEMPIGIHYNSADADLLTYLKNKDLFAITEGHVAIPAGPGLGVVIDEDAVRAAAREGHTWRSPVWRNADGGFTEW
ncbi:MAG: galactonate dehydratase [Steroidobacteraceae bacterium]|nr:galactonate dehydratase [Steroidobacteraceae bacterium]